MRVSSRKLCYTSRSLACLLDSRRTRIEEMSSTADIARKKFEIEKGADSLSCDRHPRWPPLTNFDMIECVSGGHDAKRQRV